MASYLITHGKKPREPQGRARMCVIRRNLGVNRYRARPARRKKKPAGSSSQTTSVRLKLYKTAGIYRGVAEGRARRYDPRRHVKFAVVYRGRISRNFGVIYISR